MNKKITYSVEYNPVSKTWCLYKRIEGNQSYNFYPIVQSVDKKDCQKKLKEINEHSKKVTEKRKEIGKKKKGTKALYNLYESDKLIDTDTKENLMKKYKELRHSEFYNSYFYKRRVTKYKVERVK